MAKETTKKTTKTPKKAPASAAAKTAAKKTVAKTKATAKASAAKAKTQAKSAVEQIEKTAAVDTKNPATSAAVAKPGAGKTPGPSSKLKKWNYWLAALYAIQAVAIVVLGSKISVPVTVQYPAVNTLASEASGHQVVGPAFHQLFSMELGWMVATFLIVFAVLRFMAGRKTRVQDQPGSDLATPAMRWMSFGVGGGLMIVTIALLSGIYELGTLLFMFGVTIASCILAFAAEVVIDKNKGLWTRMVRLLGNLSVAGLALPWVVFALAVGGAALWNGHIPAYMYSIYGCVFLLILGTMIATYFYFARQGRWADPLYAERSFMLLELLTASFLAWQIFAGVLHA